jgi:hypothetical protein
MHLWIALAILVLGRSRRSDDRRADAGSLRNVDAAAVQVVVGSRQQAKSGAFRITRFIRYWVNPDGSVG